MASSSSTVSQSSTSYLPESLTFLIANFQSFITVKLETSNYFAWKTQVENALKATGLFDFIDGSGGVPPTHVVDSSGNKITNPDFAKWNTVDRMLLSCLIATLTPSVLPHVVGSDYTFQLWLKLEEKFNVLSRSHIHDLRRRLYSLHKTGSMESYLDSIKEIIQKLAGSGVQIDDEELIFHTLNGLKTGYKSLKQTIRTKSGHLTFSALYSMLIAEELHVSHDEMETSTILVAPHQPSNPTITPPSSGSSSVPPTNPFLPPPPLPFQFPFPTPQSQVSFPTFPSPNHTAQRFHRNHNPNRFPSNQFSKPFSPGYQGLSFPSSMPYAPGSCQICGRNNHQALTCYYRTNLGYRPFGRPFGQGGGSFGQGGGSFGQGGGSFGQSVGRYSGSGGSFGGNHGFSPQHASSPGFSSPSSQAFYVAPDAMGYYGVSPSYDSSGFALNMHATHGNSAGNGVAPYCSAVSYGGHMPSQFTSFSGHDNVASSSGYGNSSTPPWYFDSGATSHVTPDASHISQLYGAPISTSVTVGNGQHIPVSHLGQSHSPSTSQGDLSQGALPPSSFF